SKTLLAALLALAACAKEPPLKPAEVPPAYDVPAASAAQPWPAADFWRGFKAPQLEALLAEAERNNTDLASAAARITQAQGSLGVASAALFPSVGISADASESGSKGSATAAAIVEPDKWVSRKSFSASAGASYEVDLWGRNRATRRAAKAQLVATQFDAETV